MSMMQQVEKIELYAQTLHAFLENDDATAVGGYGNFLKTSYTPVYCIFAKATNSYVFI